MIALSSPTLPASALTKTDHAAAVLLGRVLLLDHEATGEAYYLLPEAWPLPLWGQVAEAIVGGGVAELEEGYPDSVLNLLFNGGLYAPRESQEALLDGTGMDLLTPPYMRWILQHAASKIETGDCIAMMAERLRKSFDFEMTEAIAVLERTR